jgi:hypothetical protein
MSIDEDDENTAGAELDRAAIDHDIAEGAKAYQALLKNADLDWNYWFKTILGLRGLRALACARAGTANMQSQSYRDAMSYLLTLRKYSIYDQIQKQTRSDCYRLMNRLEDIDTWYSALLSTTSFIGSIPPPSPSIARSNFWRVDCADTTSRRRP